LFSAGLLGVGSLLGLLLAIVALVKSPREARNDVAWAALVANVLALLTIVPLAMGFWAYRSSPMSSGRDDSLPEPVQRPTGSEEGPPAFVPPPPPAAPKAPGSASSGSPSPSPAAPVRVGGEIQEPKKTHHVPPVFPRTAVESRVQGVVVLECTISPHGKI